MIKNQAGNDDDTNGYDQCSQQASQPSSFSYLFLHRCKNKEWFCYTKRTAISRNGAKIHATTQSKKGILSIRIHIPKIPVQTIFTQRLKGIRKETKNHAMAQ